MNLWRRILRALHLATYADLEHAHQLGIAFGRQELAASVNARRTELIRNAMKRAASPKPATPTKPKRRKKSGQSRI